MRIGIFADRIGSEGGGVESYELGLIEGLMDIDKDNHYRLYCASNHVLSDTLRHHPNFDLKVVSPRSKLIRFSFGLGLELMRRHVDILHVCMAPPLFCLQPFVLTVHDLATYLHPKLFPSTVRLRANALLRKGIMQSEKVIAVSEATKKDIVRIFDIEPGNISVIHLGVSPCFKPVRDKEKIAAVLKKHGVPDKYILYVGKIQARKNIRRLVQAFRVLKTRKNVGHKLVLVGKIMWESYGFLEEIEKLGLEEDVLHLGHIAGSDLPCLYSGADVFAFPSLFEGFGLPPLEAMACGVPVVASNNTSIPEVVGDAAFTVDPYNVEEIADKILLLLENEQVRKETIENGYARVARYSWAATARKTLQVYEEVYSQHLG